MLVWASPAPPAARASCPDSCCPCRDYAALATATVRWELWLGHYSIDLLPVDRSVNRLISDSSNLSFLTAANLTPLATHLQRGEWLKRARLHR